MDVENRLVTAKGRGGGEFGVSSCKTTAFGVDKQCDPTIQHGELYLITCEEHDER